MFRRTTGFLFLLLFPMVLFAQSPQSAVGGIAGFWVAGEGSSFNPDYYCASSSPFSCASGQLVGPTALFDFNARARWGAEGEARWLRWHGTGSQTQSDYLLGPRYRLYQLGRLSAWAKVELGGVWVQTPYYPAGGSLKGSFFAYAPGGTLDYHMSHRLSLRGDYEYQFLPSFAGPPTVDPTTGAVIEHNHGLTPNGFSVGVAYRFLGN